MNINSILDISTLFSSIPKSNTSVANASFNSLSSLLSDYNLIKTGSYGKLMSAYYDKSSDTSFLNPVTSNVKYVDKNALEAVQTNASSLLESTDSFMTKTDNLFFEDEEITDIDSLSDAVSDFTNNYNNLLKEASTSTATSVSGEANNLTIMTELNEKDLNKIGISIDENNLLSFDEDTFKNASKEDIKSVFHDSSSYVSSVALKATMIEQYAKMAENDSVSYTSDGSASTAYTSGSIIDTLF